MRSVLKAGVTYFAVVFAVGFLLGTVRVVALAPGLGELVAVTIELPIVLAASWIVCRRLIARFSVPAEPTPRLAMGGLAFGLLIAAEIGVSVLAFGRSTFEYLQGFGTAPGILGLVGQISFALVPVIQLSMATGGARRS